MNHDAGIVLWTPADGSRAVIQYLPAGSTRSDVEFALAIKNVNTGIDWAGIGSALALSARTNAPASNVVAAREEPPLLAVTFCGGPLSGDLMETMRKLGEFGICILGPAGAATHGGGAFVNREEEILKIDFLSPGKNVFGEITHRGSGLPLFDAATVHCGTNERGTEYVAMTDGYLYVTKDMRLAIGNPVLLSDDRMILSVVIAPVDFGRKDLASFVVRKWFDFNRENDSGNPPESGKLEEMLKSGVTQRFVVNRGRMPMPGREGKVEIRIVRAAETEHEAETLLAAQKVDYHARTPFHEIHKGGLIAEVTPARKGTPGVDALGSAIAVAAVHDVAFKAGENVLVENRDGILLYFSAIEGIAVLLEDRVDVFNELKIPGDIGPETGNIRFFGPVTVEGNVVSGYRVTCGDSLSIRGCVENGAAIECAGSVTIGGGLSGEKTVCSVKKDLSAGYIQDCTARAQGNITVKSYVYNSNIFSGGELRVDGMHVSGDERGAVIGGRAGAMKSLVLHSAGSFSAKTELVCGVDVQAEKVLLRVRQTEPVLARHIILLQMQIGIDVHDPKATVLALKQLPILRDRMKARFIELKKIVKERSQLVQAIPELEKRAYASDMSRAFVKINHHCVPDVLIRMGHASRLIRSRLESADFRVVDDAIVSLKAV